jgi:hypothetical protein
VGPCEGSAPVQCVGHDEAAYEYFIPSPRISFEKLRLGFRADPTADVVDLESDHVDDIMARAGRTWLDDHGIERGFTSY